MLFVYSELALGGIQTFYVRMARARYMAGKKTKILLTGSSKSCNAELLRDAKQYADVVFIEELTSLPAWILRLIPSALLLLVPLSKPRVQRLLSGVEHAHVSNSIYALMFLRMAEIAGSQCKLSIGVYHSREFLWDLDGYIPLYQKYNKELFFQTPRNRFFFNDHVLDSYREHSGCNLESAKLFPLGVIETSDLKPSQRTYGDDVGGALTMGSIGRLVSFKTYNLWALDVVKQLLDEGYRVRYIIYGDGPLKPFMENRIRDLGIEDYVELRGSIDYRSLDGALSEMDLFIGSGTSIVEAAARGIPSIVGIEAVDEPLTYGFLTDVPGLSYNEDGVHVKRSAIQVIRSYLTALPSEKCKLSRQHITKAEMFSIDRCVESFDRAGKCLVTEASIRRYTSIGFRVSYSVSNFIVPRLYNLRRKDLQKLIYG